jgi:uncharacterized protein YlzI (FlbEa/FlbD family)
MRAPKMIQVTTREKIRVRDSAEEVISEVIEFRRSVLKWNASVPASGGYP